MLTTDIYHMFRLYEYADPAYCMAEKLHTYKRDNCAICDKK